jgi:hypothetical protein
LQFWLFAFLAHQLLFQFAIYYVTVNSQSQRCWPAEHYHYITLCAAQWGADEELDACCEWLDREGWSGESRQLRAARRPKPPSLKEQALAALEVIPKLVGFESERDTIRAALEALDD